MPVYQYKCTACQERFEVEQSIRDAALTTLPGCETGDHQLKKVFSPVGISFRGGGFYRNEARTATKSSASPDKGSAGTETSSSTNGSSTSGSDKAASSAGASSTSSSTSSSSSD